MKICFFNLNAYSIFNPQSNAPIGGTEVQLYNVANYLSNDPGLQVSFIVGDWNQPSVEEIGNIKVYKSINLKKGIINHILAPFEIWRILNDLDADVYVASSAGAEIGIISLFCKLNRKKNIYRTAHDIDCNREFVKNNGITGKMFEYGIKNSTKIIVQSERNAEMIKQNYGLDVKVIKNSYFINEYPDSLKKYILWVGRLEKWKNPEKFLEIVKLFPENEFIMISQQVKKEEYVKIRSEAEKIKNLRFIEKIPFLSIQNYFNDAILFIGTSEYEGFPNTYLQACMGKTPIVSYKVNPDEFINKNNLGYCAKGDFLLMIEQIKRILLDQDDWYEKSKNAFKYVKENHNIERVGHEWKEMINSL